MSRSGDYKLVFEEQRALQLRVWSGHPRCRVAKEQGRIVGSEGQGHGKVPRCGKVLQIGDHLHFAVADANSEHCGILRYMQEIDAFPIR
jgi:hypothetical protein